jgi:hypothetical protein
VVEKIGPTQKGNLVENQAKEFLTIAGRWKQQVHASRIYETLPRQERALAMLMFYAGFSAALDAGSEAAAFPDGEAVRLLAALHTELQQVESMATRVLGGGLPS